MIIGLVAAAIIATLIMPAGVAYQQLTLDGQTYDCVSWHEHTLCDEAGQPLSMEGR